MIFLHCQSNKPQTNVLLFKLFAKLLSVSHICVSVFVDSHPVGNRGSNRNRVVNSEMMKPLTWDWIIHQAFHPAFPKVFPVHLCNGWVISKPRVSKGFSQWKNPWECGVISMILALFRCPFYWLFFVYPALINNPLIQWNIGTSGRVMWIWFYLYVQTCNIVTFTLSWFILSWISPYIYIYVCIIITCKIICMILLCMIFLCMTV